jgi:hypothetical protein
MSQSNQIQFARSEGKLNVPQVSFDAVCVAADICECSASTVELSRELAALEQYGCKLARA